MLHLFLILGLISCFKSLNVYGKDETKKADITKFFTDVSTIYLEHRAPGDVCEKNWETFREGEIYRFHHIQYQCNNGVMYPKGCFFENIDIKPGETFINYKNSSFHECFQNGTLVGYREYFCEDAKDCDEYTFEDVGGLNSKLAKTGNFKFSPIQAHVSSTRLKSSQKGCLKDGKPLKEGQEYKFDHLRYVCQDGTLNLKGCFIGNQNLLPGETIYNKTTNSYHDCYKVGILAGYREVICGKYPCPTPIDFE